MSLISTTPELIKARALEVLSMSSEELQKIVDSKKTINSIAELKEACEAYLIK